MNCYLATLIYLPICVQSVSKSCTLSRRAMLSSVNIDALKSRTSFKDVHLILPAFFYTFRLIWTKFGKYVCTRWFWPFVSSVKKWRREGRACLMGLKSQYIYARSVKPYGRLKVQNLQQSVAHVTSHRLSRHIPNSCHLWRHSAEFMIVRKSIAGVSRWNLPPKTVLRTRVFFMYHYTTWNILRLVASGGAVGWGTALQAVRSRVRFPMAHWDFSLT